MKRFAERRWVKAAMAIGLSVLAAGCGGGGGGSSLKGIDNDGNDVVNETRNITFNREVGVTPDGQTVVVVREFEKYADAVDQDGQPVNANNERSVLGVYNSAGAYQGEIRVPKNPWAIAIPNNTTAYVAADSGRLAKVNLATRTLVNVASGLGNLRCLITNPQGTTVYTANSKGEIFIYENVDQVTATAGFGAKISLKVASANFVKLFYDANRNQVVATDYTGRVFLVNAATDQFVEKDAAGSRVELLTQATPESPLIYKLQQGDAKPFAAFEPVVAVTAVKAGSTTANNGQPLALDHDNDPATASQNYAWKFDTATGELKFYRGTATTAGNEITTPLVEKNKTLKASDLRIDLTLVERFYTGNRFNLIEAATYRAGGSDWLLMVGQNVARADGGVDDPNDPSATDRDNQFQVYEMDQDGALPLALLSNCTPDACMRLGQSPRDMAVRLHPTQPVALVGVVNYEDNDVSFMRFDFGLKKLTGVDVDGNGPDIARVQAGGLGPWALSFSPVNGSVYTSNLLSQTLGVVQPPSAMVADFP